MQRLVDMEETPRRLSEAALATFAAAAFEALGVPPATAALAARSLLDASLLGIDSHGIEAMEMYIEQLRAHGLDPNREPALVTETPGLGLWDLGHGFGLAGARTVTAHAIDRARQNGTYLATCRNANHVGACGVYGKMASDAGLIGLISQQTLAVLAPWGGRQARISASPVAFVAPVEDGFPFYFDATLAQMTRGRINAHRRSGEHLPAGVALDRDGQPTRDPEAAWHGQILPIGQYKGIGLAMALEILSSVLSGNQPATDVPSIVSHPERSADLGLSILIVDPGALMPRAEFARRMRDYVTNVEACPAWNPTAPPRYPGRHAGENWENRRANGIPVSSTAYARFARLCTDLHLPRELLAFRRVP